MWLSSDGRIHFVHVSDWTGVLDVSGDSLRQLTEASPFSRPTRLGTWI